MKKNLLIISLFLLLFILNGCGFKDIDKRYFVMAIGIDAPESEEHNLKLTLKLAIPSADLKQSKAEDNFHLVTQEADTVSEAVRVLKSRVDKELDFGHAKLIVFGENFVKGDHLMQVMDWLIRRRDIQKIAWVGIGKPDADKILNLSPKGERIPSNALFLAFGRTGTESPYISPNQLFNFQKALREEGISAYLPVIEVKEQIFNINEVSFFKNYKEKLRLDKDMTKNFNIMFREFDHNDIKVKTDDAFFILSTSHTFISYDIVTPKNERPYLSFNVKFTGVVEESAKAISTASLNKYGKLAAAASKKRVEATLKKFQEAGVDPLGFGLRYRATHFGNEAQKIAQWKEIYPELEFKVNVQTEIEATGLID